MVNSTDDNIADSGTSKKWTLVLLVVLLSSLGVFLPPIVSIWIFKAVTPLVVISGTEYVSLLTFIVSAYFGANVWQKHIETKNGVINNVVPASVQPVEVSKTQPIIKEPEGNAEDKEA